ncbi:MBL fold metallo-hydrolase [Kitasatospora sp. NBC_01287]|uniref:MBL fold metallo-hydrolase n=1 Tax=Kitasatospora sp. NBC_01287 TaxID=2903573 RepID=UPI00224F5A7E|nr:MBL fold metallo-hydrolase [Kitasatospora sp. NBC_01287]MCX4749710.1 MBL fold metallo-hydrolase [Kitasatospora sp. NBC_01287]
MKLTKFGHACVRIEQNDTTVVIDPGLFTEPAAVEGADALLITHEHFDHFTEDQVRAALAANPGLRIWTNRAVADQLAGLGAAVSVVGAGDAFEVGGIDVLVHGEWHAVIHPDAPPVSNIGFLLDGRLFHPGDALTVPEQPVATLLLPIAGPWNKVGELIDYVRELAPGRVLGIHDAVLSDIGLGIGERWLGEHGPGTGVPYGHLRPGAGLELDAV